MSDILKKFELKAIKKRPQYGSFIPCQEALKQALNTPGLPSNRFYLLKDPFMYANRLFILDLLEMNDGYHLIVDLDGIFDYSFLKNNFKNTERVLYYQPLGEKELFEIIHNILKCNSLDSIIISNIEILFPLIFDMKQFIRKIYKLEQLCLKYKKPIFILSPYNEIKYNEYFSIILSFSSIKNNKYSVKIERNMINFSTGFYNVIINKSIN